MRPAPLLCWYWGQDTQAQGRGFEPRPTWEGEGTLLKSLPVRAVLVLGTVALAAILLALLSPIRANAVATVPAGFQESVVFSGLNNPTNVEFSKDGRVIVAEKSGL